MRASRRPATPASSLAGLLALAMLTLLGCERDTPGPASKPADIDLRVMSFNIEWGGGHVRFESVIEAIRASGADIVGIQEAEGQMRRIATDLGWHYNERNYLVSRFPVIDPPGANGKYALVEVAPGRVVAMANVHLPSDPYGPDWVKQGREVSEVLALEREARLPYMQPYLEVLPSLVSRGIPVFISGDFNAPSHLDWTADMVGSRPFVNYPVAWPVSAAVAKAGFRDSWREVHPDPRAYPGLTWFARRPAIQAWNPADDDPQDRIDLLWFAGPARVSHSEIVGEQGASDVSISVMPWPSDHRAVVSSFQVTPAPMPTLVAAEHRVTPRGRAVHILCNDPSGGAGELLIARNTPEGGVALVTSVPLEPGQRGVDIAGDALEPGWYRLVLSDAQNQSISTNDFWILDPAEKPSVQVMGERFKAGEPVPVSWQNAPGYRNDWLGVFPADAPEYSEEPVAYIYLGARSSGMTMLQQSTVGYSWPLPEQFEGWPLPPGRYVLRLLQDDGYKMLGQSKPFTVE